MGGNVKKGRGWGKKRGENWQTCDLISNLKHLLYPNFDLPFIRLLIKISCARLSEIDLFKATVYIGINSKMTAG